MRKNIVTKRRKTCAYVMQTYPHVYRYTHMYLFMYVGNRGQHQMSLEQSLPEPGA